MPDDETTPVPDAQTPPVEPVVDAAQTEEPVRPHPLEAGGERFNEVYGRMKAAEARAEALQAQISQQQTAQAQAAQAAPVKIYTAAEVQTFIDAGRITPAQGADYLAEQRVRASEQQMERRFEQRQVAADAQSEVTQFLTVIPALHNPTSDEFSKVRTVAWEIARDLGLEVTDARVQKQALRQVFGTLDKVKATRQAGQVNRTQADTHTEVGGGGSQPAPRPDVMKGIPKWQMEYWRAQGYTAKEMENEAKYFSPKKRMTGVG